MAAFRNCFDTQESSWSSTREDDDHGGGGASDREADSRGGAQTTFVLS